MQEKKHKMLLLKCSDNENLEKQEYIINTCDNCKYNRTYLENNCKENPFVALVQFLIILSIMKAVKMK